MKTFYFPFSLMLLSLFSTPVLSQSTATYNIVFTSVWNASDHGTLPSNPHWSSLVGANHNSDITFLEMGGIATQGIEDIAEEGSNSAFNNEVNTSIGNGDTEQYIGGNSLGTATGTITINKLEFTEQFPLLTLVSMIAPSPDWMIAINSIELRESGNWKGLITIDLFPYDAGTDNGTGYSSGNADNTPHDPISSLQSVSPFGAEKIGTLTITLQSVLGTNNYDLAKQFKIYPNPSKGEVIVSNDSNRIINNAALFNNQGRLIRNVEITGQNARNFPIELKNLSSGLYFIKLQSEDGASLTKKIIVE